MNTINGYAAEKFSGKWVYSPATKEDDEVWCTSWKMRQSGKFFETLEEAEQFCKEMNEGLWV